MNLSYMAVAISTFEGVRRPPSILPLLERGRSPLSLFEGVKIPTSILPPKRQIKYQKHNKLFKCL